MQTEVRLIHETGRLREMILENPDMPIVVIAGENANSGEWSDMYCTDVRYYYGEILDCKTPYDTDTAFTDREDFKDKIFEHLSARELNLEISNEELEKRTDEEAAKYDEYWVKVIEIYADN